MMQNIKIFEMHSMMTTQHGYKKLEITFLSVEFHLNLSQSKKLQLSFECIPSDIKS